MDEVLHVIQSPRLWPEWPYLRVERRTELRTDSPFCVLVANELHEVEPTVYFSDNYPPGDWFTPDHERAMEYASLEEVKNNGWKPYYLLEPIGDAPLL